MVDRPNPAGPRTYPNEERIATTHPRIAPTATTARPCFVHIGTHKTGTTSIQAFLAENRERLGALGLFVPRSAGNGEAEFACHHGLVTELLGEPSPYGGLDAVSAELRASDAPAACITSENLSLLYDRPPLLARLRDAIVGAGFEPVIVVYLRPQLSYATAIYAANVQSGYRASFGTFLADVDAHGCYIWDGGHGPPFDYAKLLDAFAAAFGSAPLLVRRFTSDAPDTALLQSFTGTILPAAAFASLTVPPKRANRTLTFAGVLRALDIPNDFDEHLRFAPCGPAELLKFSVRFRAANHQLAARYGLRLPVFEPIDVARAIPLRRSLALTRQLRQARAALAGRDLRSDRNILAK